MEFHCTTVMLILLSPVFSSLLVLGSSSSSSSQESTILQCLTDQLKNSTDVIISAPESPSYPSLLQSQNLRPTSASPNKPLLVVTPQNASQIQAAVNCSRKLGVQVRVRSGGHDYEGLSYTCHDPFIIIDMRNMSSVTIDPEEKTAWIQAGATLGQLYYALAQKGNGTLAFPAGVCPTVGVGGQFSGGGYGMLSRKHGLASDQIVDATLIDADGRILNRASMGAANFWALRGGGGASFGVVVEFKVTLAVVPETVTVFKVARTSEQNATQLVYTWQQIPDRVDRGLLLRVSMNSVRSPMGGNNRTIVASFNALYLGGVKDLLPLMRREFPELGLAEQDCTEMSWIESVLFFADLSNQPVEVLLNRTPQWPYTPSFYKGKSDFVAKPITTEGLEMMWRFLHEEAENRGALEFSPLGGVLSTFAESETPFPHRAGNIFMIRYGVTWDEGGDSESEKHLKWIRALYLSMARYVTKNPRRAYFNYKDLDIGMNDVRVGNTSYLDARVWGRKYFKNNFERLVRVKSKLDPSNFFRNELSIPIWSPEK